MILSRQKKKIESSFPQQKPEPPVGEDGQVILFAEPEKPKHQPPQRPAPKRKVKAEQQNLFGENPQENQSGQKKENEEVESENLPDLGKKTQGDANENVNNSGKSFNVGETIEFEL